VNEARGIHHWFQVNQRLAGSSNLTLKLQVSGADAVRKSGENAVEVNVKGLRFQYSGLKVWDAKGRELEARMEALPEQSQVALIVNDAKATYPVTIDPTWTQEAKLTASDKEAYDNFGSSVSLSGDRAIVGAPYASPGGTYSAGAAYVFTRASNGTWTQEAKLVASDKAQSDYFGNSVSLSGDRAVVGAMAASPGGTTYAGAAYIFTRASNGAWTQEAKLTASDKAAYDYFSYSVSLSGDRAVVGAMYASHGGTYTAGAAYVFTRASNGTWTQEAKLTASDKGAYDQLGYSVSISGDRAIVGANNASPGRTWYAGAAYVFTRAINGTWTEEAKLTASDKALYDQFGYSVSLSGDRALVGAIQSDSGGTTDAGAAYVFTRASNGTWTQEAKLTASDKAAYDRFGNSISLTGDRAIVGAPNATPDGTSSAGAAYVFTRASDGTWTQEAKLTASDKAEYDNFGSSVSLSGDRAIVGAPYATSTAGAAYVFNFPTPTTITVSFPTLYLYGGVPGFYGGTTRPNAGTVTLSEAAPSGGVTVNLSAPGTTIPSSVTIPAGATTATFDVSADRVSSDTVATVTASASGYTNGSASLKVLANAVFGPSFPQREVNSSSSITGTLKLVVPALTDFTATLSSSNPSAFSVPSTVVVPAGASQVTFTATSGAVSSDTVVTVSAGPANEPSGVKVYLMTVKASRQLVSVSVSPIHYGRTGTGRVELSAPAQVGGQVVALKSNRGNVTVPATVLVPEGETGANFTVTSTGTVATSATITATVGKVSKTATVTVVQPALASVTLTPASVVGGNSSTMRATLTAPAPRGGVVVSLSASNGFATGLPATVTIPEGQTFAEVTVNTAAHTSATPRTVTLKALVSANRSVASAMLTITRN
jgi:regulation of enolase protein 1 (concanavalin A-like superfamily)